MAGLLEKLKKQMAKEMDERIMILSPKIDESNRLLKEAIDLLKKIEVNTR